MAELEETEAERARRNAIKYSGRTGRPLIVVRDHTQGEVARYEVESNGTGIAKKDLTRLFEMFSQLGIKKRRDTCLGCTSFNAP